MNNYIIPSCCLRNRIEVPTLRVAHCNRIKTSQKKKEKGKIFLTLVKTIQWWHASLTVCIQDKSAF